MKRSWRIVLGFLISGAFIYFALRGQDFGKIRTALAEANYWYLLPALVVYFTGIAIRSFRWSVLLRPLCETTTREVLPVTAVGYMANNVLPLRTGEIVRSYLVSKRFGTTKTAALATIAVERLFDGLVLVGFILVSATLVTFTSELRHLAIVAFILFSVGLLGVILLTLGGSFRDRLMQIVLGPLPTPVADKVEHLAESFLLGLGVMTRKKDLALVSGASIAAWLCEASTYFVVSRAFGIEIRDAMGFGETLLTTGVGNLATLLPSSPGYFGAFEGAIILVLNGAMNVSKSAALSYALVLHAMLYFPVTIWGGFEWFRMHLSLKQVEALDDEGGEASGPVLGSSDLAAPVAASRVPSPSAQGSNAT